MHSSVRPPRTACRGGAAGRVQYTQCTRACTRPAPPAAGAQQVEFSTRNALELVPAPHRLPRGRGRRADALSAPGRAGVGAPAPRRLPWGRRQRADVSLSPSLSLSRSAPSARAGTPCPSPRHTRPCARPAPPAQWSAQGAKGAMVQYNKKIIMVQYNKKIIIVQYNKVGSRRNGPTIIRKQGWRGRPRPAPPAPPGPAR